MMGCILFLVGELGGICYEDGVDDGVAVRDVLDAAALVVEVTSVLVVVLHLSWAVYMSRAVVVLLVLG